MGDDLDKTPFVTPGYHPKERVVRAAKWFPHHWGVNKTAVQFEPGGPLYDGIDCVIPLDRVYGDMCALVDYPLNLKQKH